MKHDILYDAIGEIDAGYLAEYLAQKEIYARRLARKRAWRRTLIPLAACLCCFAVTLGLLLRPQEVPSVEAEQGEKTGLSYFSPGMGSFKFIENTKPITLDQIDPSTMQVEHAAAGNPVEFDRSYVVVAARPIERLPDLYIYAPSYGPIKSSVSKFQIYRMGVVRSYGDALEGEFYYMLPERYGGDLCQFDTLLLTMHLRWETDKTMMNMNTGEYTDFHMIFRAPYDNPSQEYGSILAYTDGVFDLSLWELPGWEDGAVYVEAMVDHPEKYPNSEFFPARRGWTVDDAFALFDELDRKYGTGSRGAEVIRHAQSYFEFETEEARQFVASLEPTEHDRWLKYGSNKQCSFYRHINGVPTNERVYIDSETEQITTLGYHFTEEEIATLADIPGFLQMLNLSLLEPPNIDPTGWELHYVGASGWYEKTEDGIYSFVRVSWTYRTLNEKGYMTSLNDVMYLSLTEYGIEFMTREEMLDILGDKDNPYLK